MTVPIWRPSDERVARAAMTDFVRHCSGATGVPLTDYDDLHAFSVERPAEFWPLLADYLRLPFVERAGAATSDDPMPRTRWFEGATLNYAQALLFPAGLPDEGAPAIIGAAEGAADRRVSWRELRGLVARVQAGLMADGVGEGDAVVAFAANVPETVALLLACAGVGALFSCCSPDFGLDAAEARFGQLEPKVLFATTGYRYGGKEFDTSSVALGLAERLSGRPRAVELPHPTVAPKGGAGFVAWDEWLGEASAAADAPELVLEPLPFDHPLYVLYSSGTTGKPKAMVHRAGGALLTHMKEHRLHSDVRPGDVVYYFTTCGWMMWNWLVSALAQAATVVLYDGAPAWPDMGAQFALAERVGVTFFGTSARFIAEMQAAGFRPADGHDLAHLRTVASTGSPLSPAGFRYVYDVLGDGVHLASISGGTDIVSCFMLGVPTLPVYEGQIQRPGLGVDLRVLDPDGVDVVEAPGELVCAKPLPSMPLRFLHDPDFARYEGAYFGTYPGLWRHGDLVERTAEGGLVVYGRSDATLNPGGVRIGTAELYRPLEAIREVAEAVAVGKRVGDDQEIWLLVRLATGAVLSDELVRRIRSAIREGASPRHVPRRVLDVPAIPRTRSGKAMEIAVTQLVNGRPVPNIDVMANPESVELIRERLARE